MRKILATLLVIVLALNLVACGGSPEKEKVEDEDKTVVQEEEKDLDNEKEEDPEDEEGKEDLEEYIVDMDELKEALEMSIGEADKLISVDYTDNDIFIKIDLEKEDVFGPEAMAAHRYSSITDELLENSYWENITVEFIDVGTITMNSSQAKENEYGKYFDTLEIEENLK